MNDPVIRAPLRYTIDTGIKPVYDSRTDVARFTAHTSFPLPGAEDW